MMEEEKEKEVVVKEEGEKEEEEKQVACALCKIRRVLRRAAAPRTHPAVPGPSDGHSGELTLTRSLSMVLTQL